MLFTESMLSYYASPVSETEDEKCKRAINMIRDALRGIGYRDNDDISLLYPETSSYVLAMRSQFGIYPREVLIFVQGSYANKTNIRSESDVDIAVELKSTYCSKHPFGILNRTNGASTPNDTIESFKDDIERLLKNKFPRGVERHNKSIKVNGNTYRVDADVVPCQEYRDYTIESGTALFVEGVKIQPDRGTPIINYPKQHIKNGIDKNRETKYQFKKMVRIAKYIRVLMEDAGIFSAKNISSFLIESLFWNVSNAAYTKFIYYNCFAFNEVLSNLYDNIDSLNCFKEINGIKFIGDDDSQRVSACRAFIRDLKAFYDYSLD